MEEEKKTKPRVKMREQDALERADLAAGSAVLLRWISPRL
jgi:hypothetical protein